MSFERGALIGKRYRLEQKIGSGGMGEVFAAIDTVLERPVAIKIVDAVDARRAGETSAVFLREARIASAIAHPAIVRILDFGIHAELLPFIAMELLEGESLADLLTRRPKLPRAWVLDVVVRALEGLAAAHAQGVVHRDIKPENIYLADTGNGLAPKILDFGISKTLDNHGRATVTTQHGHVVGTPAYMSPEQARGVRHIDKRTDVYSMGVVLYELLTGDVPFVSENPGDLLMLIMSAQPEPLRERVPDLSPSIAAVVMRALAKDPDQRFADAQDMLAHLIDAEPALGAAHGPLAGPTGSYKAVRTSRFEPRPSPLPRQRRTRARALVVGAVSAAAFALGILVNRWGAASSDTKPRYIVVQSAKAPSASAASTAGIPPLVEPLPPSTPKPKDSGKAPAKSARSGLEPLAEAFRSQKSDIEACVNAYPRMAELVPKLSLKFALDVKGDVQSVGLRPEELTTSPLGTCILSAARAMRFAEQSTPIAFEVPLTARRGGAP